MSKKKKEKGLKTALKRILICFVVIYIAVIFVRQQFDIVRLDREADNISAKIEEQKRENLELQSEYEASQTDEYVERVARERLGYMKPHEKVFIDSAK